MLHVAKIQIVRSDILSVGVHYDACDLSSTFLHGMKLGPEHSEEPNHAAQSAKSGLRSLYSAIKTFYVHKSTQSLRDISK